MKIGWTLNVVIMEAELTRDAHKWYLEQAREQQWSKKELLDILSSDYEPDMEADQDNSSLRFSESCGKINQEMREQPLCSLAIVSLTVSQTNRFLLPFGKRLPLILNEQRESIGRPTGARIFIQDTTLEKYALELDATKELVGLAAYRDMPEGVLVYVEYMESAPSGNPTLSKTRKYAGIGAALLAFGIQLPIDYGYGGAIYLKAKTTQLREHYMRNYGAIPFSRFEPFLLLIDGDAARELFGQYLKEV